MATDNRDLALQEGWVLVATGPQSATINLKFGVGEFATAFNADAPPNDGHWFGQRSVSMALGTGENLYVKGYGRLVATADTLAF